MKFSLLFVAAFAAVSATLGEGMVKNGEVIAFVGDSITEFGDYPAGYINMVMKGFEIAGVQVGKIPAGHSAETSQNMVRRFAGDVVTNKPAWVTISCGVNDVKRMVRKEDGKVDFDAYQRNVRAMLDMARDAGIRPVLLTPTLRGEDTPDSDENQQILMLCGFLREEAAARGIPLADLNALMRKTIGETPLPKDAKYRLTKDGVHMNYDGNAMMAKGVLAAFGVETTPAIEAAWRDLPDARTFNLWLNWDEAQALESAKKNGEKRKGCAERLLREAVAAGRRPAPQTPAAPPRDDTGKAPDIVFVGDRVVAWGNDVAAGWVPMVAKGLEVIDKRPVVRKTAYVRFNPDMRELLENAKKLAEEKPAMAVLVAGSNVMRPKRPADFPEQLAELQTNMLELVDLFVAAGSDLVVCGLPVMSATCEGDDDKRAVAYNDWLRGACAARKVKFADLHAAMAAKLKAHPAEQEPFGEGWLTHGWYHLIYNFRGNSTIAETILEAFGRKVADAPEVMAAWRQSSGAELMPVGFSLNEWDEFRTLAAAFKMDVPQFASEIIRGELR